LTERVVGAGVGAGEPVERILSIRRTARYYTLGSIGENTRELWLVCHGYAQLAGRFIRSFAPVVSAERGVVAPEGLHRFYLDPIDRSAADRRVGATWMTREAREADIGDYIAYLDQLCTAVLPRGDVRLTALGFSQGTATVARWAAATERSIDHLILWGAGLPPDLDWQRARHRLRSMRISIVAGTADEFWTRERVREQEESLQRHGLAFQTLFYDGGHHVDAGPLDRLTGS
jgi:predicted esterase